MPKPTQPVVIPSPAPNAIDPKTHGGMPMVSDLMVTPDALDNGPSFSAAQDRKRYRVR